MGNIISRILGYRPDLLIVLIVLGVVLALIFPADGAFADVMDWIVKIVIAVLFFLYGARLYTREALGGLMHWRLHLLILIVFEGRCKIHTNKVRLDGTITSTSDAGGSTSIRLSPPSLSSKGMLCHSSAALHNFVA